MTNEKWLALWEAVKLPLRILVLAIIPLAVTWLTDINTQWAGIATTLLVILDKYLHEAELTKPKTRQNKGIGGVRGLTGF